MSRLRRLSRRVHPVWLLAALVVGCGKEDTGGNVAPTPAATATLNVAAASDLRSVLPLLIDGFRLGHPKTAIVATYGASGQLAQQLKAGGPFDLFLSADKANVEKLAADQVIDPATIKAYAVGSLVLVSMRESGHEVEALGDLVKPEIKKVAIANPATAPYGGAAKQVLQRAGLWDKLQPKLVTAESVRQAFQFVNSGNADAGLVSSSGSDAMLVRVVAIDRALYDPLEQTLGVVAASKHKTEAVAFADYIVSDAASNLLDSFNFKRPPGTSSSSVSKHADEPKTVTPAEPEKDAKEKAKQDLPPSKSAP